MGIVAHPIGSQRLKDSGLYRIARRHLLEPEDVRRMLHALQVGIEAEDAAIVYPEAFPDGVPALHRAVEHRYFGFVAGIEAIFDIDQYVLVFFIKRLQHGKSDYF